MVVRKVPKRLARIIRDCRDARLDVFIPLDDAISLYRAGRYTSMPPNQGTYVSADQNLILRRNELGIARPPP